MMSLSPTQNGCSMPVYVRWPVTLTVTTMSSLSASPVLSVTWVVAARP